MNRVIAIYARKSIEKVDSISIESQIDFCKYEARGNEYRVYSDNGYSGKNTDRPAFNNMMNDIKKSEISTVIVYKLDRISRSILDFSTMMEVFQENKVQFISATEKFDTDSPIGRAMLNICIVFAQLERETIQQRVADAYYSRSKKGFYMGGKIPYGFSKQNITMNGTLTSKYIIIPDEAEDIEMIYKIYSKPETTLGDVLREICKISAYNKRGKIWSTARLSEMMRNPIYCRADYSIYEFYKSQGSNLHNNPEDYIGINGLYLFQGTSNSNRKTWDLAGREVVLAPHEGIIDARTWLVCRKKILRNHQVKTSKPKNTWLAGVVKCGNCGYAMVIKKNKTKTRVVRYFVCSCMTTTKVCSGVGKTIHADEFENQIEKEIKQKISELSITSPKKQSDIDFEIERYKIEISKIEEKITSLIDKIYEADKNLMKYMNEKIDELDKQKKLLENNIYEKTQNSKEIFIEKLENCVDLWGSLTFDDKVGVVRLLITKIKVYKDSYCIDWTL